MYLSHYPLYDGDDPHNPFEIRAQYKYNCTKEECAQEKRERTQWLKEHLDPSVNRAINFIKEHSNDVFELYFDEDQPDYYCDIVQCHWGSFTADKILEQIEFHCCKEGYTYRDIDGRYLVRSYRIDISNSRKIRNKNQYRHTIYVHS